MSKISIKEISSYSNYGKCVEISNGIVKIIATLDVGPRIINYSFIGGENIFFEDTERNGFQEGEEFKVFGQDKKWYIYGGHRLWTSPEAKPRSYYPDNDKVEYVKTENGIRLIPPLQVWTQLQLEMEIIMSEDSSDVQVIHKVTNHSPHSVELAPWALTVMSRGGLEAVPQPTRDTGLLGNRLLALWPYTKLTDERVSWKDKYIFLRQNPENPQAFKFGINTEHPFVLYFNHGDMFIKKFDINPEGVYPDGGMNYETYTNDNILEMESLGELKAILPEATAVHNEYWSLHKEPEIEISDSEADAIAEKYNLKA